MQSVIRSTSMRRQPPESFTSTFHSSSTSLFPFTSPLVQGAATLHVSPKSIRHSLDVHSPVSSSVIVPDDFQTSGFQTRLVEGNCRVTDSSDDSSSEDNNESDSDCQSAPDESSIHSPRSVGTVRYRIIGRPSLPGEVTRECTLTRRRRNSKNWGASRVHRRRFSPNIYSDQSFPGYSSECDTSSKKRGCVKIAYKWCMRRITGRCEIERLAQSYQPGAIENCLIQSKQLSHTGVSWAIVTRVLHRDTTGFSRSSNPYSRRQAVMNTLSRQNTPSLDDVVDVILDSKPIVNVRGFTIGLERNLVAIQNVTRAMIVVDELANSMYDFSNSDHEQLLSRLWELLCPGKRLSGRVSKDWGLLGFQGDDPATDFRGSGILGLHNLLFLSETFNDHARCMLQESHHPNYWYSFAITGINITKWLRDWLSNRYVDLQKADDEISSFRPRRITLTNMESSRVPERLFDFFYQTSQQHDILNVLGYIYSYMFYSFHKFWFQCKPSSVMEFPAIAAEFKRTFKFPPDRPAFKLMTTRIRPRESAF